MNGHVDNFLFDMAIEDADSETMQWLRKQKFYQEWQRERSEYARKFPCIDKVLEGQGEIFLTEEEHEVVVHYLEIEQKMESAERREYYRFGHVHALRYWDEIVRRSLNAVEGTGVQEECLLSISTNRNGVEMDNMTLRMHYQEKYEQGYEEGIRKRAISVATRMIEDGDLSLEKVALYSELTLEQVIELEKELQSV